MRTRTTKSGVAFFVALLAVVAGVIFVVMRGGADVPELPGCTADVAGRTVSLEPDQASNATLIAAIGVRRGLPARAVSIALATAYQESKIRNLPYGDRDSLGLFQQRPSQGWGSIAQISNEYYAINKFYDELEKVDGYQTMPITRVAQRVQRSGYPEAYAVHAPDARALASSITGFSPGGTFSCVVPEPKRHGTAAKATALLTKAYGALDTARTGARQDFSVTVPTGIEGERTGWSVAAYLLAHAGQLGIDSVSFDGLTWHSGRDSEKGWVRGNASAAHLTVSLA